MFTQKQKLIHECSQQYLFTIAEKWKGPKRPSTGKWISKIWCHKIEYYLEIKSKELMVQDTTQMNHKDMLSVKIRCIRPHII